MRRLVVAVVLLIAATPLAGSVDAASAHPAQHASRRAGGATAGRDGGGPGAAPAPGGATSRGAAPTPGSTASGGGGSKRPAGPASVTPTDPTGPTGPVPIRALSLGRKTTGTTAVALTFDDGPGPQTAQLLALLRQHHVKATFCVVGVNVRAHPELVQAIVRDGHTLCNHTWRHRLHLGDASPEVIRADLAATNDEIHRAVPGVPIKYFRHPGGNFTPAAVEVARQLGMESIAWQVDPRDWDLKRYPPGPSMTEHVVGAVRANVRPGSIVLSHDGGGERRGTIDAYRTLLPELAAQFGLIALPT